MNPPNSLRLPQYFYVASFLTKDSVDLIVEVKIAGEF